MKLLKKKSRTKSRGKRTNYFPILCCVLFVALLLAYKALLPHKTVNQITATAEKLSDSLSSSEYTELKKEFKQIINEKNPTEAIEMLQEKIDIDPKIERSCHGLAHEIGRYAFAKYGFTEALIYQDDICGTGYIHGIIEAYFVKVDNPKEAVLSACSTGTLHEQIGKCRHGVGHGLMFYSKNDVTASLKNCDLFTDAPGRIQCAEGVFMENFNSDERFHTSKYLDTKNPFYPCDRQTNFYKDPCYFYAPDYYLHLHPNNYNNAIKWCDSAEPDFILKCDMGVGSRTMKYNMGSPEFAEKVCMLANTRTKQTFCIDGMVSYFLVHYNSLSRGRKLCPILEESNQATCYQSVINRSTLFLE